MAAETQTKTTKDEKKAKDDKPAAPEPFDMGREPGADDIPPPPPAQVIDPLAESDAEGVEQARRRYLLKRFWITAKGFWSSRGDRRAWLLTVCLLIGIGLTLAAQYGVNVWNRAIFDALQNKDAASVFTLTGIFIPLAAASVGIGMTMVALRMMTQRRWRAWLNAEVLTRWLSSGRYYQLNLVGGDHKNPESRISEDLRISTDAPVDFVVGVVSAALSAATFIVVLWTIGGSLKVTLGGSEFEIPGFLVIAAILYAAIASTAMIFIGKNFVSISEGRNQAEAEYRYALTRIRENGESIALLGGEEEERAGLDRSFGAVFRQWALLAGQHVRTTIVSQGSSLVAPVVPLLLAAPKFLDGSMTLGQVMQAASAFTIVQAAFGWLVDNYPRLADWNACARRIASLMVSLDALERAETGEGVNRIEHGETEHFALRLDGLSVTLDDGKAVVNEAEVEIEPGERVLVAGESGTGKSTLVRAIAGLWPWGEGRVEFRRGSRVFLLPQRPYVPSGTLRRATTYPAPAEDWSLETIGEALDKVGLGHLKERLEEDEPWEQTLSGGEKQRLAFARLLLHQPDLVVLDEATSALDPPSQDKMMALLSDELKERTIVSVAHRPELEQFHSRKIVLERRKGGAKLVSDIELVPRKGRRRLLGRWLKKPPAKKAA
jgi:vitamin B12/bleomycin/antimicrobial peptide transport system ATP-binding/permease protein